MDTVQSENQPQEKNTTTDQHSSLTPWQIVFGAVLIAFGLMALGHNFGMLPFEIGFHTFRHLFVPFLLVIIGIVLLTRKKSNSASTPSPSQETMNTRKLYRSRRERKVLGVCGGLSEYFDLDPTIIRVAYVLLVFGSFGFGILFYLALAFIVPERPITN